MRRPELGPQGPFPTAVELSGMLTFIPAYDHRLDVTLIHDIELTDRY